MAAKRKNPEDRRSVKRSIALTEQEDADLRLVARTHRLPGVSAVFRTMSLIDAQSEAHRIRAAVHESPDFRVASEVGRLPRAA